MHVPDQYIKDSLEQHPEEFACQLLRSLKLPDSPLRASDGWSNQVWLASAHVVRFSSGRFRDSFAHERDTLQLLPPGFPHAPVRGYGRVGRREWLVQDRVPGKPLDEVWPSLNMAQRRSAIRQLGKALQILHAIPLPTGFNNPWLTDAIGPHGQRRDAYHIAPEQYPLLLDAALLVPGAEHSVLEECGAFIAERLGLFANDSLVLVHCDLHFANLLWENDRLTAILDFEGARPAPADMELDTCCASRVSPGSIRARWWTPGRHERELSASRSGWLKCTRPSAIIRDSPRGSPSTKRCGNWSNCYIFHLATVSPIPTATSKSC